MFKLSTRRQRKGRDVEYAYYKIRLHNLTEAQKQRAEELYGVSRFIYNTFLASNIENYESGQTHRPNYEEMCKILTRMRNEDEYSWLANYDISVERSALKDLDNAYERFFDSSKRLKSGQHLMSRNRLNRFPKFKRKKTSKFKFGVRGERITFCGENNRYVHIPGLTPGRTEKIDCKRHNIPYRKGMVYDNARVIFDGRHYWLTVSIKVYRPLVQDDSYEWQDIDCLGVDVGIREAAVTSDGSRYEAPNMYRVAILNNRKDKIRRAITRDINRRLKLAHHTKTKYEDIPKSKNQIKREQAWLKAVTQIHNLYESCYHKISKQISRKNARVIVLETLDIPTMRHLSSKKLSTMISQANLARLTDMIEYKCKSQGSTVVRAPYGYKSTKICSRCGHVHDPGKSKVYSCPVCGLSIDRDLNASINLMNYGLKSSLS